MFAMTPSVVGVRDDVALDVDDEEGGVGTVSESGHSLPFPVRRCERLPGTYPAWEAVDPFVWRCQRALARIEPTVEAIVAEHATSYWQRGAARYEA